MPRTVILFVAGALCTATLCLAATMAVVAIRQSNMHANPHTVTVVRDGASNAMATPKSEMHPLPQTHPVIIRQPSGPPRIELAGSDPQGRSGSVACSTCHSVRQPNLQNVSAATLDEFHLGMTFDHGTITCYACHDPDNADSLHLADGTSLPYENVMTLCSQCHGSQATAFAHGAHGGMNGYWDLTRGPQTKNNCVDCHDPHVPEYPKMIVGFKPRDRFHQPSRERHDHEGADSHADQ